MERQQRLEREYAARVVAMLEPIVGADHVRVNVALTLKRETTEQTQETWDPERHGGPQPADHAARPRTAARRRWPRRRRASCPARPGRARTCRPRRRTAAPAPRRSPRRRGRRRSGPPRRRNNEIGVTKMHTIQPAGEIARLSVAVIVDDDQQVKSENGTSTVTRTKRTSEELKKFENLVGLVGRLQRRARRPRDGGEHRVRRAGGRGSGSRRACSCATSRRSRSRPASVGLLLVVVLGVPLRRPAADAQGVAGRRRRHAPSPAPRRGRQPAAHGGRARRRDRSAARCRGDQGGDRRLPVLTKRVADAHDEGAGARGQGAPQLDEGRGAVT